jgi:hypothetical protein
VADYYLYLLDGSGGIVRRIHLEACPDDNHARDIAAGSPHLGGMELWLGGRLVETYDELRVS